MRDIKNKFFMPYMVIEFVLFLASFFLSMTNELIKANIDIFVMASFALTLVFAIIMVPMKAGDKWFAIILSSTLVVADLFYGLLNMQLIGSIFFILALTVFFIRLVNEYSANRTIYYITIGIISLASIIISFFFYIAIVIGITLVVIYSVVLTILVYRSGNPIYRVNWFMGGMGIMVFDLFIISITIDQMVPETALVKSMLGFASKAFLIPANFLMIISYTLFEQKDSRY